MAPRGKKHARHVVPDVGLPRDAKRMQRMLESMDVKRFEPNVAQQLLELMHRARTRRAASARGRRARP